MLDMLIVGVGFYFFMKTYEVLDNSIKENELDENTEIYINKDIHHK